MTPTKWTSCAVEGPLPPAQLCRQRRHFHHGCGDQRGLALDGHSCPFGFDVDLALDLEL